MNKKVLLCFLIVIVSSCFKPTEAFTINAYDLFSKPFGILADKLFNWGQFKPKEPFYDSSEEIEIIEDLVDGDANLTDVKRNYFYGCECQDYRCSCCAHVEVNRLKLNNTGCLNMSYSNMDNIELDFDLDGNVLYNNSISIINPPDLCFGTPVVDLAKLCIKFYQLDARNKSFSGSVDLIAKLSGKQIARIKLGSFRFGNASRFFEQNIMSVYFNKNSLMYSYGNLTDKINKFSLAGKNMALETYKNLINKLPMPEVSINFQPDKVVDNWYKTLFGPRIKNKVSSAEKKSKNNFVFHFFTMLFFKYKLLVLFILCFTIFKVKI